MYKISDKNGPDTHEALGNTYGVRYETPEEAENALTDLESDWDPDWGEAPELEIIELGVTFQ